MPNTSGFSKNDVPDNISALLNAKRLVPKKFQGTDKYLDVISWNIRWFDATDVDRVKAIADVLGALNADFFVLTEIAADGALEEVCNQLAQAKAGFYSTHYGTRIDLHLITREADANAVPKNTGVVIKWKPFDDLASMVAADRTDYFKALKQRFSDHLPVLSRFYLTERP